MKLELFWNSKIASSKYVISITKIPKLLVSPNFVSFGKISNPATKDTTLTLTAVNLDITISNIKLKYGSNNFEILNTTFPLFIPKNTSKSIKVRFNPIDSSMNYANFEIETNNCLFYFSANGGFPGKKIKVPTLKLTHPNGGEVFVAGSDSLINWEGISPTDNCSLELSTNDGLNWDKITTDAINLKYNWNDIPLPSSDKCLIRINQIADNDVSTSSVINLIGHKDYVNCVAISQDGSFVATASNDGSIKIWDVYTGLELRTLLGHNGIVSSLVITPDGSKIISGGADLMLRVWDVNNGVELKNMLGHQKFISCIAISPDGSKIASSGDDKFILVWDLVSGTKQTPFYAHTKEISSLAFSSDGTQIVSASYDNTVKVWEASTGLLIQSITGKSGYFLSAVFSTDGSKIITGGSDLSLKIWDTQTSTLLKDIFAHNSPVNSVAFSQDGSLIVTGSEDKSAKVWDASSYSLIQSLEGHKDFILSVTISLDGSKILTGSRDGSAKIWNLDIEPFQSDQSNAVFSIVAPTPSSKDIDLKECLVGDSKDSLISEFVMNKGSYPYRVDSVYFTGADASAFSQVSGFPKFIVNINSSKTVELRFNPSRVGLHQAKVHIITQTDTLIQNITGIGIQPTIQIVNDLIDFGYIDVGSTKDTLQAITIKNISNVDIDIKNTYHSGPNDKDFITLAGGGAFKFPAGETAKLDMRFLPTSVGRTSGTLMFEYDGIGSPAVVQLFGAGIGGGQAALKLDTIETKTSTVVRYTVKLILNDDVIKSGAKSANFEIEYNNTLLYPLENYKLTNVMDKAILKFLNIPLTADPIQILDTLKFKTGLGNAIETSLTINNFEINGATENI